MQTAAAPRSHTTGRAPRRESTTSATASTPLSGIRAGMTRPNVRSIACSSVTCAAYGSRATVGWTQHQEPVSAPAIHPTTSSDATSSARRRARTTSETLALGGGRRHAATSTAPDEF